MKLWRKGLISICVFLMLLLISIGLLISTTPGLHVLLKGVNLLNIGLSIQQINGSWRNLTLSGVKYKMPGINVDAQRFHLAINLNCLLHESVCINDISLRNVNVEINSKNIVPAPEKQKENNSSINFSTSYPITLSKVHFYNINVKIDDAMISLHDFTTGLHWQNRTLTLWPTHIRNLLVALPKAVTDNNHQVLHSNAKPLGKTLQAMFAKPILPELPKLNLPLDISVQKLLCEHMRITGDLDLSIISLFLKAKTVNRHLKFETFNINFLQGNIKASGETTLADNWPVNFTLNGELNFDPIKGEKFIINLGGAMRDKLKLGLNLSGPVRAQFDAVMQPSVAGLPLSLNLVSQSLRWPLNGPIRYQADNLDYHFEGKATNYVMSLRTMMKGEMMPTANISVYGKGNVLQFNLDKLRITAMQGNVNMTALVDWSKAINWRSELTLSDINTAKQYPDWPAKLEGKIVTCGSLYNGSWQLSVPQLALKGNIRQNEVRANGSLTVNSSNQWKVPGINITLGRNHLNVKGELKDELNFDVNIDAPQLDNILPGLSGIAKSTIKARGTLQTPQVLVYLIATGLRWQQLQVRRIVLKSDVKSIEKIICQLQLRVEQLQHGALKVNLLKVNATGNEQQHQLKINVQGEPVSGQLALNGHIDRKTEQWQGTLNNARFKTPVGEWHLLQTMAINYFNSKHIATIGPHCWQNSNAQICIPKPIEAGPKGRLCIVLNHFDLVMIKPFLTNATKLDGVFSGDAHINWTNDGALPTGTLSLKGHGVKIEQDIQGNTLPFNFDRMNLKAVLRNGRVQLDWLIHIINNGQLSGNIQINDPQNRRQLSGNIEISNINLSMFNPIFLQGEKINGNLNGNLILDGGLQYPQVFGQLGLSNLDIDGSFMPVNITRVNLNLVFNGMSSTLNGLIQTSNGNINLNGKANWSQLDNWHAYSSAHGHILVTVPPMVRMDVSTDLMFEATPTVFSLNGKIDIPWARITVQEVPKSSISVSLDEVILDESLRSIQPKISKIPINSNLVIHVGNDVQLSVFDLKAKLSGDLKLVQYKTRFGLNGQINIPSGRFHAYGQDLIVRKGEFQFAGPLDHPYVNLEAIRNPDSTEDKVVAGLRVTGLINDPQVEMFSEPAMSQQEALSYLLRGQGLRSDGNNNALTSALISLGVAQSGQIIGKIGDMFGVRNLKLDTIGVGDKQQVQVSGYVLPDLQIKYGVGIFNSLATFTLRYRLMPKLYLEAMSGLDQALDFLYQFEF